LVAAAAPADGTARAVESERGADGRFDGGLVGGVDGSLEGGLEGGPARRGSSASADQPADTASRQAR
jgi:hypothetical protein